MRNEIMNLEDIVAELRRLGQIDEQATYAPLTGGSVSQVALLTNHGQKYVVKANEPIVLQAESQFLQTYRHLSLFPHLTYIDPEARYIVYPYLPGRVVREGEKSAWLSQLARNVIHHYQPVPETTVFGWIEEPSASWSAFLTKRLLGAHDTIGAQIEEADFQLLLQLAQDRDITPDHSDRQPYLLHGDFGVHNFLFQNGQVTGVIDPTPVIGDPIYDLVYAFCSSPDDLQKATIATAAAQLSYWKPRHERELAEEVLLGLYCRISTCIKRHPQDLPAYLSAWREWREEFDRSK